MVHNLKFFLSYKKCTVLGVIKYYDNFVCTKHYMLCICLPHQCGPSVHHIYAKLDMSCIYHHTRPPQQVNTMPKFESKSEQHFFKRTQQCTAELRNQT